MGLVVVLLANHQQLGAMDDCQPFPEQAAELAEELATELAMMLVSQLECLVFD